MEIWKAKNEKTMQKNVKRNVKSTNSMHRNELNFFWADEKKNQFLNKFLFLFFRSEKIQLISVHGICIY